MNKLILLLGLLLVGLWGPGEVQAQESEIVFNYNAPHTVTYHSDFDVLVMDFKILYQDGSKLNTLTFENRGNLPLEDIVKTNLWLDKGSIGFQGFDIDENFGNLKRSVNTGLWYITDLNLEIPKDGLHFFLTVDLDNSIDSAGYLQFQIPQFIDINQNNKYNEGDSGIFYSDKNINGPTNSVIQNVKIQEVKTNTGDNLGPKIQPINFSENVVINSSTFTFEGYVKDVQGGSVQSLQIAIVEDGNYIPESFEFEWKDVVLQKNPTDDALYEWYYTANKLKEGVSYYIYLIGTDNFNNSVELEPILIEYRKKIGNNDEQQIQEISIEDSSFNINRDIISLNSKYDSDVFLRVKLRDIDGKPIAYKKMILNFNRDGVNTEVPIQTDENGESEFSIQGNTPGDIVFDLYIENKKVFDSVKLQIIDTDLKGSLIKSENNSAVYLLNDGKRYVFPSQHVYFSYYDSFEAVEVLSLEEISQYPIIGNITYRPGTLIKIPSVNKVYRVNKDAVINWLETEDIAIKMYGENWAQSVKDVSESFFVNYTVGDSIK